MEINQPTRFIWNNMEIIVPTMSQAFYFIDSSFNYSIAFGFFSVDSSETPQEDVIRLFV